MKTESIPARRYATIDFLKAAGAITILFHHYFSVSQYGVPTALTGGGGILVLLALWFFGGRIIFPAFRVCCCGI